MIIMMHSSGDVRGWALTGKAHQVLRISLLSEPEARHWQRWGGVPMPVNGAVLPAAAGCRDSGAGNCVLFGVRTDGANPP
jgi:hypothetical protein